MKKTIYEAPAAEQINVRFEENIMSVKSSSAPEAMDTTHSASEWGGWQ